MDRRICRIGLIFFMVCLTVPAAIAASEHIQQPPRGFVYIEALIPDVILEMRYAGSHNFGRAHFRVSETTVPHDQRGGAGPEGGPG